MSLKEDMKQSKENPLLEKQEIQSSKKSQNIIKKIWTWFTESKQRLVSVIFLVVFITLMIVLGFIEKDPTLIMLDVVWWFQDRTGDIGLYIGVGVISIFGNFVMFIPVLYAAVLMFVAFMDVNIFFLGIAAGIGASIGQIASWFVGRATKEIASEKLEQQFRKAQRWIELGLAPLMIFIFAATPLPDEVLLIMLGLVGYSLAKTLIYCFIGKIVLTLSISYVAHSLSRTVFGDWLLRTLFGLTIGNLETQTLPTESNIWTSILVWIISAIMIVLFTLIDWVAIFDRKRCSREQEQITAMIRISQNKNPQITPFMEDDKLKIKGENMVIKIYDDESIELFPEKSLWFFEEIISEKRKAKIRNSMISTSAILGKSSEIIFEEMWLENFRENILNNKFTEQQTQKTNLVQMPANALTQGFVIEESRLITFNTRLINLINGSNPVEDLFLFGYFGRKARQILRKKIQVEVLVETQENNKTKIWGIGIKEGTYINKIVKYPKEVSLFFWLNILNKLVEKPTSVKNLKIYKVLLKLDETEEFSRDPGFLDECPI